MLVTSHVDAVQLLRTPKQLLPTRCTSALQPFSRGAREASGQSPVKPQDPLLLTSHSGQPLNSTSQLNLQEMIGVLEDVRDRVTMHYLVSPEGAAAATQPSVTFSDTESFRFHSDSTSAPNLSTTILDSQVGLFRKQSCDIITSQFIEDPQLWSCCSGGSIHLSGEIQTWATS
jgi:hypothetical protein